MERSGLTGGPTDRDNRQTVGPVRGSVRGFRPRRPAERPAQHRARVGVWIDPRGAAERAAGRAEAEEDAAAMKALLATLTP